MADERMTSAARELYARGPTTSRKSRYGAAGLLARRLALRLVQPFAAYQRQLDLKLLAAVETLEIRRNEQESRLASLARELHGVLQAIDGHQRRIDAIEERTAALPYMADSPFQLLDQPVAGRVLGYTGAGPGTSGSYASFEDVFRGPEDRVRELQRVYIELLDGRSPVLDVGCGRGEFLDLLRDSGLDYKGVDSDASMVERARAKGHPVEVDDGVRYLAQVGDASLAAIFSAQVIEHLPYHDVVELLRLARLKLAPGGMLILETVNPHDPQALKTFWVDPTHRHPIFPEALLALCRINGFGSAYAFHPSGSGDYSRDTGRQGAYAVVATRAAT